MCVEDYHFKHYLATKEKICRKFTFVKEGDNHRTFLVNISQFEEENDNIALCKALVHLEEKGLNVDDYEFELPQFNNAKVSAR